MIVADALYLNAPFLNTVLDCHMDAVIRLKDEERLIYKDAKGLFEKGKGERTGSAVGGNGSKRGIPVVLKWKG